MAECNLPASRAAAIALRRYSASSAFISRQEQTLAQYCGYASTRTLWHVSGIGHSHPTITLQGLQNWCDARTWKGGVAYRITWAMVFCLFLTIRKKLLLARCYVTGLLVTRQKTNLAGPVVINGAPSFQQTCFIDCLKFIHPLGGVVAA